MVKLRFLGGWMVVEWMVFTENRSWTVEKKRSQKVFIRATTKWGWPLFFAQLQSDHPASSLPLWERRFFFFYPAPSQREDPPSRCPCLNGLLDTINTFVNSRWHYFIGSRVRSFFRMSLGDKCGWNNSEITPWVSVNSGVNFILLSLTIYYLYFYFLPIIIYIYFLLLYILFKLKNTFLYFQNPTYIKEIKMNLIE